VIVEIRGINPPGRRCNPALGHGPYEDVYVGLGRHSDPIGLVPGDTDNPTWRIEVRVVKKGGALDYRGPHVDGKRGERHIYINWLNREPDGELRLFRRGKVMLDGLAPRLVDQAESTGAALACTIDLTNDRGYPTTGAFRPQQLDWRVAGA
jgi:Family of unknown function (DUF5990)